MASISSQFDRIRLVLLALLMASFPFHVHISSVLMILCIVLNISKLIFLKQLGFQKVDILSIICAAYFLLEVIGLFYTESGNMKTGFSTLEKHLPLIIAPVIFFQVALRDKDREVLFWAFVGSCFIATLLCIAVNIRISLAEYKVMFHEWRFSHDRVSEPIGMQAVYFAMHLSMAILILLFTLKEKWRELAKSKIYLFIFLSVYFLVIVVALGTRTMIAALMIAIMINVVVEALRRKSYKALLIAALVPILFVAMIFQNPVVRTRFMDLRHTQTQGSNYDSYFARTNIWGPGLEAITENFWFGAGTGDDQMELDKKFVKYNNMDAVGVINMHSQYFQSLLGNGIVALCIFLLLLIYQFRRALLTWDYLYLSFLLLFALGCLTESMLNRNKGIVFFLIFSFIFYKSKRQIPEIKN